ncbi:MAG: hypothetical protein O3A20_02610 [Planctomycetota bacterium]|nr:hypothetical protein [Planctomycetota bacterium]
MPNEAPPSPVTAPETRRGRDHADLQGGTNRFRFRPDRLTSTDFGEDFVCRLQWNGQPVTMHKVLDASRWGFAFEPAPGPAPVPGSEIPIVELIHRGEVIWTGRGVAAYLEESPRRRIGVRLFSATAETGVDLDTVRVRESVVGQRLTALLELHAQASLLPKAWLAQVGMMAHLLQLAREAADATEAMMRPQDLWREPDQCAKITASIYAKWGPVFQRYCLQLEKMSAKLSPEQVTLGHDYAQRALMPLLMPCPMHRRAYEKPLGYAGDYRLMELIQDELLEGDTLYGRFLHHVGRSYTLAETVQRRDEVASDAIRRALKLQRPVRIASLACGPAIELQRVFAELPTRKHPVELVMIDQDEDALGRCHQRLLGILNARPDSGLITMSTLHFSIRQIVLPKPGAEQKLVDKDLHSFDLVYSMGLFDYIQQRLARAITGALWKMLGHGGRLLIGNLVRVPDSSWMMEYATEWNLIYRDRAEMLDLASDLIAPPKATPKVRRDSTGRCLFLDAVRD